MRRGPPETKEFQMKGSSKGASEEAVDTSRRETSARTRRKLHQPMSVSVK